MNSDSEFKKEQTIWIDISFVCFKCVFEAYDKNQQLTHTKENKEKNNEKFVPFKLSYFGSV